MTLFSLAFPELFLALSAMFLLLLGCFWKHEKTTFIVTYLAAGVMGVTALWVWSGTSEGVVFHGMFAVDAFRRFIKVLVLVSSGLSLLFAPPFFEREKNAKSEYSVLVVLATLGMMLMISAHDLMALYVGLELQNLALYILVSFQRDQARSSEAGLKYFTLGALSSCILIFGLSLIYGFSGTTSYDELSRVLTSFATLPKGLAVGIGFVVAGLAFKISVVPFHMWTPDVYEGAPTPVTAFLAAAPKMAAFALLVGFLVQPMSQALFYWQPVLAVLAVASMLLGSFVGLAQTNVKRLMAYSAILNMGTILIGLVVFDASANGVQGLLIYLMTYAAAILGFLGALTLLRRGDKPVELISDLSGLSQTHPFLAFTIAVSLFSLAGIPPLAGFFGKYFILLAAVQTGWIGLALIGVLTSVVAAAYYLKIIKIMYFDAVEGLPQEVLSGKTSMAIVGLTTGFVFLFVLCPAPLIEGAQHAAESLMIP